MNHIPFGVSASGGVPFIGSGKSMVGSRVSNELIGTHVEDFRSDRYVIGVHRYLAGDDRCPVTLTAVCACGEPPSGRIASGAQHQELEVFTEFTGEGAGGSVHACGHSIRVHKCGHVVRTDLTLTTTMDIMGV